MVQVIFMKKLMAALLAMLFPFTPLLFAPGCQTWQPAASSSESSSGLTEEEIAGEINELEELARQGEELDDLNWEEAEEAVQE